MKLEGSRLKDDREKLINGMALNAFLDWVEESIPFELEVIFVRLKSKSVVKFEREEKEKSRPLF